MRGVRFQSDHFLHQERRLISEKRPPRLHALNTMPPPHILPRVCVFAGWLGLVAILHAQKPDFPVRPVSEQTVPIVLLPGKSAKVDLEFKGLLPTADDWEKLELKFTPLEVAGAVPDQGSPLRLQEPLKLDAWHSAKGLGLNSKQRKLQLTVVHQRAAMAAVPLTVSLRLPDVEEVAFAPVQFMCAGLVLAEGDKELTGDTISFVEPDNQTNAANLPPIIAFVAGLDETYSVHWWLESNYARRGDRDNVRIPLQGAIALSGNEPWAIVKAADGLIFGGDGRLSCEVFNNVGEVVLRDEKTFKIRGRNPINEPLRKKIDRMAGEKYWFAWAVGQHESRQNKLIFNQFNNSGKFEGEPNYGRPDGWGVFQLDSARGYEVTTEQAWDWEANLRSAMEEFDTAEESVKRYLDAVRRTYPEKYESLPPSYTVPGTKTKLTSMEAAILQLYNGAAVVAKLKTKWGSWSHYRCAWRFDPDKPSGQRWTFVKNKNDYVATVVKNELEGGIPVEE